MTSSRRDQLLDQAMTHVADTGFSDFGLRSVAAAIGTSHRMLSHHFGSKAGLEKAIVERLTDLMTAPLEETGSNAADLTARELIEGSWAAMSSPSTEPLNRLYFDLSSRATLGNPVARDVIETIRDHWTTTALATTAEDNDEDFLARAAMTSSFLKGLLLDHLSGGSIADSEAALEQFIRLVESSPEHG